MDNSSNIAFALIAGFIVYITVKGELPAYLCVVGIGENCPTPPADTVPTKSAPTQQPTTGAGSAPPSGGGNNEGGYQPGGGSGIIPVFGTIGNPGWGPVFPPFPTGPTIPQSGGPGFGSTTKFYCEDPYGNPVDCEELNRGAICYDENGQAVNCD